MSAGQGKECWLGRGDKICQLIDVPKMASRSAGKIIGSHLKCKFSSFMASGGTCIKLEVYSINHNMLRT